MAGECRDRGKDRIILFLLFDSREVVRDQAKCQVPFDEVKHGILSFIIIAFILVKIEIMTKLNLADDEYHWYTIIESIGSK